LFLERKQNAGNLQQFCGVTSRGAGGRRQPNAVTKDNSRKIADTVRGKQSVRGVAAGGGTCAVGLHTSQRVTVASQVF